MKALFRASSSTLLTVAYQHVHQSDVPRFDQVAQRGYLRYGFDPQVRQLGYARSQTYFSHRWLRQLEATVSLQRSLEGRYRQRRGESAGGSRGGRGRDAGLLVRPAPSRAQGWRATTGLELYHDRVAAAPGRPTSRAAPRRRAGASTPMAPRPRASRRSRSTRSRSGGWS